MTDTDRINAIKIRPIKHEQTRFSDALVGATMLEHIAILDAVPVRDPAHAATIIATDQLFRARAGTPVALNVLRRHGS